MTNTHDLESFTSALTRWREGCQFYFKFDLAVVAAIAALVSFFKLEGESLFSAASEFRLVLIYLTGLLVYAVFFELNITNTANRPDLSVLLSEAKYSSRLYRVFSLAYGVQVLAHAILLIGILAFSMGYVEGRLSCLGGSCGS